MPKAVALPRSEGWMAAGRFPLSSPSLWGGLSGGEKGPLYPIWGLLAADLDSPRPNWKPPKVLEVAEEGDGLAARARVEGEREPALRSYRSCRFVMLLACESEERGARGGVDVLPFR